MYGKFEIYKFIDPKSISKTNDRKLNGNNYLKQRTIFEFNLSCLGKKKSQLYTNSPILRRMSGNERMILSLVVC